jgi:hypothetical protein
VLLTSRPHPTIDRWLEGSKLVTGQQLHLYTIGDQKPNQDIQLYVETHMFELTEEERMKLVLNSGGLFIWAATAVRMYQHSYRRRPDEFLERVLSATENNNLDHLYLQVLHQALVDPGALNQLMQVLQIIITAVEPVSIAMLQVFLPEQRFVNQFVQDLCSVVKDGTPHRPLRILHPTFREFIFHVDRANGFLVKSEESNDLLARVCFKFLSKHLTYDLAKRHTSGHEIPISNNPKPPPSISQLPQEDQDAYNYSMSFWPQHVAQAVDDPTSTTATIEFFEQKFLNWLEALSLCGMVPIGLQSLTGACQTLKDRGATTVSVYFASLGEQKV